MSDLHNFILGRLPTVIGKRIEAFNGVPSLHEDFWVSDRLNNDLLNEDLLRQFYRWTRKTAIDNGLFYSVDRYRDSLYNDLVYTLPKIIDYHLTNYMKEL